MTEQCRYCGRQRSSDLPMNRGLRWWECDFIHSCRDALAERVESLTRFEALSEAQDKTIAVLSAKVESMTAESDDLKRRLELWRNEGYAQEVQKLQERCLKLERERDSMKTERRGKLLERWLILRRCGAAIADQDEPERLRRETEEELRQLPGIEPFQDRKHRTIVGPLFPESFEGPQK